MKPRVVITGLGVAAPNGIGREAFWEKSLAGGSCIDVIDRFDPAPFACRVAGQVRDFDAAAHVPRAALRQSDRSAHMAFACCDQAVADAGLVLEEEDPEAIGMSFANLFGGMEFAEPELFAQTFIGPHRVSAYQAIAWFYAAAQGQWSIARGIRGSGRSVVADRAGGLQALLLGALAIQQGHASVVLAGGFEAPLAPYVYLIHESSGLLARQDGADPRHAYRPFDASRAGLVLGEGAGILVLEELEHALARGARVYAELAGGAMTCGGRQTGGTDALARCLAQSVEDAGLRPEQVDAILPEGLAVPEHDAREAAALHRVFGEYGPPTVTVPKAQTGHTLAAAGALDALWATLMLHHGVLLPTPHLEAPATEVPLDFVLGAPRHTPLDALLCASSGMGGIHTALVLRRHEGGSR